MRFTVQPGATRSFMVVDTHRRDKHGKPMAVYETNDEWHAGTVAMWRNARHERPRDFIMDCQITGDLNEVERRILLEQILAKLNPTDVDILWAIEGFGMQQNEAAAVWEVTSSRAHQVLQKALEAARRIARCEPAYPYGRHPVHRSSLIAALTAG